MRHKVAKKKLNRDTNHRKALLRNMVCDLIAKESITTTETKAKVIVPKVERLLHKAKADTIPVRRQLRSILNNKEAVSKLVDDLAKRYSDRTGGYLTTQRIKRRLGDNAIMVTVSFIPVAKAEEDKVSKKESKAAKTKPAKAKK
jgi:large subunit ribosomal protein L17